MGDPVETFRALLSPEGGRLLASLPAYEPAAVIGLSERLRSEGYADDVVAAALTQSRLRARARGKLGDRADRLFLTPAGLEQTTRWEVASRRPTRYRAAGIGDGRLLDLCCGIGGDLLPTAAAGLTVTGVDRDPLTAAVAAANVTALGLGDRADVVCADVADVDLREVAGVFVDPARRGARGRTFDPNAFSPPYDSVLALADTVPATGAKLAPGIPHALLPTGAEAEWVSVGGDVVECALWCGPLAGPAPRRATLLPSGATVTGTGRERAPVGPVRALLHEPDGAVIRAGLVAEVAAPHGATLLDPRIAYLGTDEPVAAPFLASYRVLDVMPFGLKRLRTALRARGVGRLTVKKRGSAVDPDALRARLRLTGDAEGTVVLTRVAGEPRVLIVEPLPP